MKSQELTPQETLIAEGIASKARQLQEQMLNQNVDQTQIQFIELITTAGAKALSCSHDNEVSGLITSNLITTLASYSTALMVRNQLAMDNEQLRRDNQSLRDKNTYLRKEFDLLRLDINGKQESGYSAVDSCDQASRSIDDGIEMPGLEPTNLRG